MSKSITKRGRPSNALFLFVSFARRILEFSFVSFARRKERIRKRRSAMPPMNRFVTLRFQFKKYDASKYAQRIEDTMMKFWRNVSLNLISLGEKSHLKTYMELGW